MTDLGFKAGIEIHQRLDTHKLFCHCKSRISEEEPVIEIKRQLRPVAGEMGEVDRAALFEALRKRKFHYLGYQEESCLVEADEEPPHDVNQEALKVAIQIAKMLHCEIPDEMHFMRKTVIDGSNTAGFQRTAIIGLNGYLETSLGRVGVTNVCLEEEAAQIIEKRDNEVVYGLDRLGIPLVEIGTAPDIKSPKHAREVAEKIGTMLRETGKVQRGIGTIRQDINVSIRGGARIEIKGFQELKAIEKVIEGEVERQKKLLKIRDELKKRDASVTEVFNVTSVFKNTKNNMISSLLEKGKGVFAFKLSGFGGLLKEKICYDKTFGKELSDYAKSHGVKGFIHSDENLGKYNLTREFLKLRETLNAGENDVIGIVVEDRDTANQACLSILKRAENALVGVPEETRMANEDYTTSYLRPLPGGARMYPETDVKPIVVTKELVDVEIPESFDEKKKRFIELGLSEELAGQMIKSEYLSLFEEVVNGTKTDYSKVAYVLLSVMKDLKRRGVNVNKIDELELKKMFKNIDKIPKESIPLILERLSKSKSFEDSMGTFSSISQEELDKIIEKHLDTDLIKKEGMVSFNKIMGPVMSEVRGRIDGEIVAKRLKSRIEEIVND
ncbi:MAG: Glu-tRNA(Gln) amidotransferase subunit GatE [Candidatus Aenigmarchaeota archaeon]|nr:Glu-tRNA(Gln) amidotransferase subunit GatE [Candidatus Aenigmarchaeota archaeon]